MESTSFFRLFLLFIRCILNYLLSIGSRSVLDSSSIVLRSSFVHPSFILRSSFVRWSKNNRRMNEEQSKYNRRMNGGSTEDQRRMFEELTEEERRLIEGLTILKLFAICSFIVILYRRCFWGILFKLIEVVVSCRDFCVG